MISDAATNRRAVLGHHDLAAKLTQPPLDYALADQWNGFVPPELWNGQVNDSPRRAALVELVDEALRRNEAP